MLQYPYPVRHSFCVLLGVASILQNAYAGPKLLFPTDVFLDFPEVKLPWQLGRFDRNSRSTEETRCISSNPESPSNEEDSGALQPQAWPHALLTRDIWRSNLVSPSFLEFGKQEVSEKGTMQRRPLKFC